MKLGAWLGGLNIAMGMFAEPFDWVNYFNLIVGFGITIMVLLDHFVFND